MAIVASVNGITRRIYLSVDTINAEVHPINIYKEVRALRKTNESLRKFDNFLEASGNISKGGGKFTPRLVKCIAGTRIVPYNTTHRLTITGEIITDDEQSGVDCFDKSLVTEGIVDINYIPPQVEVIQVVSGSGVTQQDKIDISDTVWANIIESGISVENALKIMLSILAGKTTKADAGGGNTTIVFRDINDTKNRVTANVINNNRTSIEINTT